MAETKAQTGLRTPEPSADMSIKLGLREFMKNRETVWNEIKAKPECDVLILGAGVNGTGLLRELALHCHANCATDAPATH